MGSHFIVAGSSSDKGFAKVWCMIHTCMLSCACQAERLAHSLTLSLPNFTVRLTTLLLPLLTISGREALHSRRIMERWV